MSPSFQASLDGKRNARNNERHLCEQRRVGETAWSRSLLRLIALEAAAGPAKKIDVWWEENIAVSFQAGLAQRGSKNVYGTFPSPDLIVSSGPWISLQGDEAAEANPILFFHPNKLNAEP